MEFLMKLQKDKEEAAKPLSRKPAAEKTDLEAYLQSVIDSSKDIKSHYVGPEVVDEVVPATEVVPDVEPEVVCPVVEQVTHQADEVAEELKVEE